MKVCLFDATVIECTNVKISNNREKIIIDDYKVVPIEDVYVIRD